LNPTGAAALHQRIERGAGGSGGEDDLVDEDHALTCDLKWDFGAVFRTRLAVISESSDVDSAARNRGALNLGHQKCESLGDGPAAAKDADHDEVLCAAVRFQYFVSHATEGAPHVSGIHQYGGHVPILCPQ
jgi:hypothetical protein